ncbi:16S rRNA (uracil(1498)-N(3))-methyltransferase [Phenylobacterium sp.]|jgi:16S rRNA (uracil1498-N3)-methyltransferase|uniref:16S rRNA (uracil(1498)-N(3))-methyltransferase n=1 Tax=Phenylobacterium sp. TaxID=1871053 RepID=UPI002E31978E|nr:16S rRNA (uracil(1498)-N(3))-methyltransferase [Phenylobacterium sp.]HEX2560713.1 16S rRNA (uracil(1498)-N(3))-methyltransferase [Phenylobacterium sp.]
MIRLNVAEPLATDAQIALGPEQSHYLSSVMRRQPGDALLLFNGADGEWLGIVLDVRKKGVVLQVKEKVRDQIAAPDLELVVALVKRARLETIVEKAAELGAARVRLVITERTNADHAKVARLQAIAVEAAEQTGRLDVPQVLEPVKLPRLVQGWDAGRRLLFCDEGGDAAPALQALSEQPAGSWAVLIGPEGGFSPVEREVLRALPYATAASLGPRILRADTAAIAALTLWQAALGDWRT